jgi:hypothetical protein
MFSAITRHIGSQNVLSRKKRTHKDEEHRRRLIAALFDLLGRPPKNVWNGEEGTVQQICTILGLSPRRNYNTAIKRVLNACAALKKGECFDSSRKRHVFKKEILTEEEKQHLADSMEDNYASLADVTEDINVMRAEKGETTVSVSSVWRTLKKMDHEEVATEQICQGSDDPHDNWCLARFDFVKQTLIRFGLLDPTKTLDPPLPRKEGEEEKEGKEKEDLPSDAPNDDAPRDPAGNPIPPYFDIAKLTPIPPYSIAHWDETHKKVVLGCPKKRTRKFRRKKGSKKLAKKGENGETCKIKPRLKHVKFPGEVRLLLGVACVQLPCGKIVGLRCRPYDYTGKTVCSEKDMKKYEREEMYRVKNLKKGGSGWVIKNRRPGDMWCSESLMNVKGVGKTALNTLSKMGINTVGDFNSWYSAENVNRFRRDNKGWSEKKLQNIYEISSKASPGSPPADLEVDYRKAGNSTMMP